MDKPADPRYGFHSLLQHRWSPRAFDTKKVQKEKLQRIFEAASWAPSSFNEQPWRFIVGISGDATYSKIFNALLPGNQVWAKSAPVLVFILGKKTYTYDGTANQAYSYDAGQAAAHLTFQAQEEGLYVHQMGGINSDKAKMTFDVPDDYEVLTAAAIGYIGNPKILPNDLKDAEEAPRERKPLSEVVFNSSFGNAASFTENEE